MAPWQSSKAVLGTARSKEELTLGNIINFGHIINLGNIISDQNKQTDFNSSKKNFNRLM